MRRRLQVVSSNSPVPSSPIKPRQVFFSTNQTLNHRHNVTTSQSQTETSFGKSNVPKSLKLDKNTRISTKINLQTHALSNKSSGLSTSKREGKPPTISDKNTSSSIQTKTLKRNNSGIWQVIKTWNAKRKETKTKEQGTPSATNGVNRLASSTRNTNADSQIIDRNVSDVNLQEPEKLNSFQSDSEQLELGIIVADESMNTNLVTNQNSKSLLDFVKWENEQKFSKKSEKATIALRTCSLPSMHANNDTRLNETRKELFEPNPISTLTTDYVELSAFTPTNVSVNDKKAVSSLFQNKTALSDNTKKNISSTYCPKDVISFDFEMLAESVVDRSNPEMFESPVSKNSDISFQTNSFTSVNANQLKLESLSKNDNSRSEGCKQLDPVAIETTLPVRDPALNENQLTFSVEFLEAIPEISSEDENISVTEI